MKYQNVVDAWNKQADEWNGWTSLGEDEKIEFAMKIEREECAKLAASTVCDTHIPTGINIYGSRVAKAIRARK